MSFNTIHEVRSALDSKQVSAVELAQEALNKAEKLSRLNAFLHIDSELTLAQARMADETIAKGQQGPLTGLPIAHKDVFCYHRLAYYGCQQNVGQLHKSFRCDCG